MENKSRYVVIGNKDGEHTLGCICPSTTKELEEKGIFTVDVLRSKPGWHNPINGPIMVMQPADTMRLATEDDFDNFRVSCPPDLPHELKRKRLLQESEIYPTKIGYSEEQKSLRMWAWDVATPNAIAMAIMDLYSGKEQSIRFVSCEHPSVPTPSKQAGLIHKDITLYVSNQNCLPDPALAAAAIARALKGASWHFRMIPKEHVKDRIDLSELALTTSDEAIVLATDAMLNNTVDTIRLDAYKDKKSPEATSLRFGISLDNKDVRFCGTDGTPDGEGSHMLTKNSSWLKAWMNNHGMHGTLQHNDTVFRCIVAANIADALSEGFIKWVNEPLLNKPTLPVWSPSQGM